MIWKLKLFIASGLMSVVGWRGLRDAAKRDVLSDKHIEHIYPEYRQHIWTRQRQNVMKMRKERKWFQNNFT